MELIELKDNELLEALLKIRFKVENNIVMTKLEQNTTKLAYKEITGKNPPSGCASCVTVNKTITNWFKFHYDELQKKQDNSKANENLPNGNKPKRKYNSRSKYNSK